MTGDSLNLFPPFVVFALLALAIGGAIWGAIAGRVFLAAPLTVMLIDRGPRAIPFDALDCEFLLSADGQPTPQQKTRVNNSQAN